MKTKASQALVLLLLALSMTGGAIAGSAAAHELGANDKWWWWDEGNYSPCGKVTIHSSGQRDSGKVYSWVSDDTDGDCDATKVSAYLMMTLHFRRYIDPIWYGCGTSNKWNWNTTTLRQGEITDGACTGGTIWVAVATYGACVTGTCREPGESHILTEEEVCYMETEDFPPDPGYVHVSCETLELWPDVSPEHDPPPEV